MNFVRPRELVRFDPRHVKCVPPIGKRIWIGRYNSIWQIFNLETKFIKTLLLTSIWRLNVHSLKYGCYNRFLSFVFFAGLVHLPHLYASFQDSQYKHVFAICLPYTDPFRYAQSVVCILFRLNSRLQAGSVRLQPKKNGGAIEKRLAVSSLHSIDAVI